jgi:AcrR family transcriptional regulator
MSPTASEPPPGTEDDAAARAPGPRERRRVRTMRDIQAQALRLFAESGYEQTTIEQIAEAADISPRTFFRYFPTKEDVVMWDEYDDLVPEIIRGRPVDEPPGETMRVITRDALATLYKRDPDRLLARQRLLFTAAPLRARYLEFIHSGVGLLAEMFATTRGLPPDDQKLRLTAVALIDAAGLALERWQDTGGKDDLLVFFDQAVEALIDGVGELRSRA